MDLEQEPEKTKLASPHSPGGRSSNDKALLEAIDEMELLLSHATQAGKVVPVKRVKALVEAKRAARDATISLEVEIEFWHEFQELGQQLQPISVQSLKTTSKNLPPSLLSRLFGSTKEQSLASRSVRRYQIWSVIALAALLVTQIYTIFGSNAVNGIQSLSNDIDEELFKIEDLNNRADRATVTEVAFIYNDIRNADTQLNQMYDRLDASYKLLAIWFPLKIDYFDTQVTQAPIRLQIAHIVLESLSKYLLPLLYGLLGACVYVLRTLSQEIKDLVYTLESDIRFQLRIYLGALAGLAIGWLITEQTAPNLLQSVTPIALAFLAGYSVELLFSAMDTIIGAFSKGAKKGTQGK